MTSEAGEKQSSLRSPPVGRRQKLRVIVSMAEDGHSAAEIAEALQMKRRAVCALAARNGIVIGRRGGTRRVGAYVPRVTFGVVDKLAIDAGVSRSAMIGRIIKAVCGDVAAAKRFLGKQARR